MVTDRWCVATTRIAVRLACGRGRLERATPMRSPAHDLRGIRELISQRKEAMREAVRQCQAGRKAAKERNQELRRQMTGDVRASIERAKLAAREACRLRKTGAKARGSYRTDHAKEEL